MKFTTKSNSKDLTEFLIFLLVMYS